MSQAQVYLLAAAALLVLGLYGVFACAHFLRKMIALNIFGTAVFLIYIAVGRRIAGEVPDPVPHAMVLTGIVISVSATALALVLARRVKQLTRGTELPMPEDPDL